MAGGTILFGDVIRRASLSIQGSISIRNISDSQVFVPCSNNMVYFISVLRTFTPVGGLFWCLPDSLLLRRFMEEFHATGRRPICAEGLRFSLQLLEDCWIFWNQVLPT